MDKRAKKVQKRNAKKKAFNKQINQTQEAYQLASKQLKRHQSMLTKSMLLDVLTNDLDESPDDCRLYFETLENELSVDFDKEKNKPMALEMELVEEGIKYNTTPWYNVFVQKMTDKYGEEKAPDMAWNIAVGIMSCMSGASEIVTSYKTS